MGIPYVRYGQDGLSAFDGNGVRRIWLDPIGLLLSFIDSNGVARCEIGNLPARGISSAHWGFRVNDANGNPQYDTNGIIVNTTRIATSSHGPPATSHTGTNGPPLGPAGIGGENLLTSAVFTLGRTQTIRIEGLVAGWINGSGSGTPDLVYVRVTGQTNTSAMGAMHPQAPIGQSAYTYQIIQLPAGTYTANLFWESINGTVDVLWVDSYSLDVWLLGG